MTYLKRIIPSLSFFALSFLPGILKAEDLRLTPLVYQVIGGSAQPVPGSDNDYHLVYEMLITNASPQAWTVERIEAIDEGGRSLLKLSGDELKSRMGPLSARGGSAELGPNQTALAWLHLRFPSKKDVPRRVRHRLSIVGGSQRVEMEGAELTANSGEPMAIGAPLRGGRWLAGDGCCDSIRHVRALLPINGKLYLSQRFAIDWEKLDDSGKIYSGDAKNPESYFCYGQDVLAVADGEVVEMLEGQPNQVPGKLPEGMDLAHADGNHLVLRLAPDRYVLYAHLKPNSIRVKRGDRVKAGQVLGQVGNTGNTSEPHLHFHMMDGPSAMASNGLPYVIQSFDLLGRAPTTEAFDKAAANGTTLEILPAKNQGEHRGRLPLDLSLVRFNAP